MADKLQMNLRALRSSMQLTLHTHHAARIWNGRPAAEDRPSILGLTGFVTIMSKMRIGAEQDDPYSDWWMLRIEERLDDAKKRMQQLRGQIDGVLAAVPSGLSLGENLNVQPVTMPLYVNAPLGFLAVYLLAEYDELARKLILAHHTALIDRLTMERWLDDGAHLLRSIFALAQKYRYTGTQRDDYAANNAPARAARERYGELPQDVLEGTRRSRFAPPIIKRSPLAAFNRSDEAESVEPAAEDEATQSDQTGTAASDEAAPR